MSADDQEQSPMSPMSNPDLVGHADTEKALLDAISTGRMHHAWLITGPRGIGKATLAYRFARYLQANPNGPSDDAAGGLFGEDLPQEAPESLYVSPEHQVFGPIANNAHPAVRTIKRSYNEKTKKMRSEIVVDDVRALTSFFGMTAGDGEWRIAIVDGAENMNNNAANALLKTLEEPPKRSLIILISHAPGRLLPTIRSRTRQLVMKPLGNEQVTDVLTRLFPDMDPNERLALAKLSDGAPGRAVRLAASGGLDAYQHVLGLLDQLPRIGTDSFHQILNDVGGRGKEAAYEIYLDLLLGWISNMVRAAASNTLPAPILGVEPALAQKLLSIAGVEPWLEVWEKMTQLTARGEKVHMDHRQMLVVLMNNLEKLARA